MDIGVIIAIASLAVAVLGNVLVAVYNYGRLGQKVNDLAQTVTEVQRDVKGISGKVAKVEGMLNGGFRNGSANGSATRSKHRRKSHARHHRP